MQVQWWEYHEVVKKLKPYHMIKNLFKLITLKGSGDTKTFGTGADDQVLALMTEPYGETFTT